MKWRYALIVPAILAGAPLVAALAAYSDSDLRLLRGDRGISSVPGSTSYLLESGVKREPASGKADRVPAAEDLGKRPAVNPALDGKDFRLRIWDR